MITHHFKLTPEQEAQSEWGEPYSKARTWQFYEMVDGKPTGNTGEIRASTEMEALDRLREAFPWLGPMAWGAKP